MNHYIEEELDNATDSFSTDPKDIEQLNRELGIININN